MQSQWLSAIHCNAPSYDTRRVVRQVAKGRNIAYVKLMSNVQLHAEVYIYWSISSEGAFPGPTRVSAGDSLLETVHPVFTHVHRIMLIICTEPHMLTFRRRAWSAYETWKIACHSIKGYRPIMHLEGFKQCDKMQKSRKMQICTFLCMRDLMGDFAVVINENHWLSDLGCGYSFPLFCRFCRVYLKAYHQGFLSITRALKFS